MGLSERILRQILTGKIMLHGLEHACQRQICRLFNLKSNICKNYIKEMEILVGVIGETEKSLQSEWFFLPDYLLYLPSWKDTNNAPPYEVTECGFTQEWRVTCFDYTANESSEYLRNKHRAVALWWSCPLCLYLIVNRKPEFGEMQIRSSTSLPSCTCCSSVLHCLPLLRTFNIDH